VGRIIIGTAFSRYARALAEAAFERGEAYADELYAQAGQLLEILGTDAEFAAFLVSPRVTPEEKEETLRNVFGVGLSGEIYGLLNLLFRRGRGGQIAGVLESFLSLVRERKGVITAEVTSAETLSDPQLENIRAILGKNLNKTVEIEAKTDKSLLGGLRVSIGGWAADFSVKRQLEDIRRLLSS